MPSPEQAAGPPRRRPRAKQQPEAVQNGHAPPEPPDEADEPNGRVQPPPALDRPPSLGLVAAERRFQAAVDELTAAQWEIARWRDPGSAEWLRQVGQGVVCSPYGLGYLITGPAGVTMQLSRLRESRGDLSAELAVQRWNNHLLHARVSLSSGTARVATAKLLTQHPAGADAAIDWREVLEQSCVQVLAHERRGDPVEYVGTAEPQPEPPRVMRPYLPAAATLVWAPQGVGKSTLARAVVVSLETFTEVIPGWMPVDERRCMVLDWESSATEWNDGIRAIALGVGLEAELPNVAYRRMRQPLADAVESVAEIRDRLGIGYLVIDSVEKAAGAKADSGTYEEKAERLFLALDRLAIPSLLIDHVAGEDFRGGASRVTPKSIGSVLKGAWARATYDLKRDPEASTETRTEMVLHNVKVNDAARMRPYEFALVYEPDGRIRIERSSLTSPELLASLPLGERMYRTLIHNAGSMTTKQLADELGASDSSIRSVVKRDARFLRLPDNAIGVRQSS